MTSFASADFSNVSASSQLTPPAPAPVAPNRPVPPPSSPPPALEFPNDLPKLLSILPTDLRQTLESHPQRDSLIEVVMDLGRRPEARFPGKAEYLSEAPILKTDLEHCITHLGDFGGDNRAGLEQTLHRISAIRNRRGEVIGLTCRVGRAVFGTIGMIRELVESGRSILLLGRPGVGKTTALREMARVLADELDKRVVIIDTSNEIAGDGDVPHPAIGRARRMQVARPEQQHQVMIEAVENHMPEVIVIDEIGTELEALAARTIAERGVQLIGTAHGNQLENLIKNPTLSDLVGGIQSVTLGDEEARRRGSQKSVLERKAPPTFEIAVEMLERQQWVVHEEVAETVDTLLRGRQPNPQVRSLDAQGEVVITQQQAASTVAPNRPTRYNPLSPTPWSEAAFVGRKNESRGWRSKGHMQAQPRAKATPALELISPNASSWEPEWPMQSSWDGDLSDEEVIVAAQEGLDDPRTEGVHYVYPFAISRHPLEQVIRTLNLPVVLTKDLDSADMVLALRTQGKNQAKLRQLAKARQMPVHMVKSNTLPQIARGLRRMLNLADPSPTEDGEFQQFMPGSGEDELEALEEARLAVEQIVIPKGQPVELLPRSATVRRMQHELIEHYHLKSRSFGDEPNRRLRIYPA
jgi:stage III sporulation protein SpoIIIAA